ncbi:hypothetical protein HDE_04784 [Halotydeus destructor]|nr:hypothetical protein HDE_04784 [Halotydeus destructor]
MFNANISQGKSIPILTAGDSGETSVKDRTKMKPMMVLSDKPDDFNGDETDNYKDWIYDYETIAVNNDWSVEEKLGRLALYMKNRARQFYRTRYGDSAPPSWEDFLSHMDKCYGPGDSVSILEKMIDRRMNHGENAVHYAYEKYDLMKKHNPLLTPDDATVIEHVIASLLPEYKNRVKGKKFMKWDDLIAKLKLLNDPATQQQMSLELVAVQGQAEQETRKCYRCDRVGHLSRQCRACWNCKDLGHVRADCPKPRLSTNSGNVKAGGQNHLDRRRNQYTYRNQHN